MQESQINKNMSDKKDSTVEIIDKMMLIGYAILFISLVFALGVGNSIVSAMIDFRIAESLGGVNEISHNASNEILRNTSIESNGRVFGGIDWTYSSVIGILMTLMSPSLGLILGIIASGSFPTWILHNFTFGKNKPFGNYYWLIWINVLFWVLRFPVPLEYSLFYWTAIKY